MKPVYTPSEESLTKLLAKNVWIGAALMVVLVLLVLIKFRPDNPNTPLPAPMHCLMLPILVEMEGPSIHWSE